MQERINVAPQTNPLKKLPMISEQREISEILKKGIIVNRGRKISKDTTQGNGQLDRKNQRREIRINKILAAYRNSSREKCYFKLLMR